LEGQNDGRARGKEEARKRQGSVKRKTKKVSEHGREKRVKKTKIKK
jgi:hypothetical protein